MDFEESYRPPPEQLARLLVQSAARDPALLRRGAYAPPGRRPELSVLLGTGSRVSEAAVSEAAVSEAAASASRLVRPAARDFRTTAFAVAAVAVIGCVTATAGFVDARRGQRQAEARLQAMTGELDVIADLQRRTGAQLAALQARDAAREQSPRPADAQGGSTPEGSLPLAGAVPAFFTQPFGASPAIRHYSRPATARGYAPARPARLPLPAAPVAPLRPTITVEGTYFGGAG